MNIQNFDKFTGRIWEDDVALQREEAIDLANLIVQMKPSLPDLFIGDLSPLADNIKYYVSEDSKWKIHLHFRESDRYISSDGAVTIGKYKSLFKIKISKVGDNFSLDEVVDYIKLLNDVVLDIYPEAKIWTKLLDNRYSIDQLLKDNVESIEELKIIIKIV